MSLQSGSSLSLKSNRGWGRFLKPRKKLNITFIFRKRKKKHLGNYQLVSLSSLPWKLME